MVVAKNFAYNQLHDDKQTLPTWVHSTKNNYTTRFRPLTTVNIPEKFELDLPDESYEKDILEEDDAGYDAGLSMKLMEAMSDPWDSNPHLVLTDLISNLSINNKFKKEPLIDKELQQHLTQDDENKVTYLPLSTNLVLKQKKHMFYFPMDFGRIDNRRSNRHWCTYQRYIRCRSQQIKLLSSSSIVDTGPAPNFQIMVANGQLENPIGTVELRFEVADFEFRERFIIMKTLPHPLIGLMFPPKKQRNFRRQTRDINLPYLSMQLTPENNQQLRASTALMTDQTYTVYPQETLAITLKMPHLLDHNATGILTPSSQFDVHDFIFIASSLSTVNNNALCLQISNVSDHPYNLATDSHIANFTVLTPEQIKHVKPVNPGELSFMIQQHEQDTEVYINELMKAPNTEEEYWFPTPEKLWRSIQVYTYTNTNL